MNIRLLWFSIQLFEQRLAFIFKGYEYFNKGVRLLLAWAL